MNPMNNAPQAGREGNKPNAKYFQDYKQSTSCQSYYLVLSQYILAENLNIKNKNSNLPANLEKKNNIIKFEVIKQVFIQPLSKVHLQVGMQVQIICCTVKVKLKRII